MKKTTLYRYVAVGSCLVVAAVVLVRALDNDLALRARPESSVVAAVERGDVDTIETLIALGADAGERDRHGNTPLLLAAKSRFTHVRSESMDDVRLEMVNALLEHGVDVNAQNLNGQTALHEAVASYNGEQGSDRLLSILLDHGANPNLKDRWGHTPLTSAASRDYQPVVAMLLDAGATIGFYDAIYMGDVERVRARIEEGHPIHGPFGPANQSALMIAASESEFEIVELLLDAGANPNAKDAWNRTALMTAADSSIAALLLERGANHRFRDNGGLTAMHYAARTGTPEQLEVLIAARAELDPETYAGEHTVHFAACNSSPAVLAWLLQRANIDTDKADDSLSTPLHVACEYRNEAQAKMLIANGANVNATDENRRTPLLRAVENKTGAQGPASAAIVKSLLEHGADASLSDIEDRTPKELAYGHSELKGILW